MWCRCGCARACRDASAWREPDHFDPDRFARPDSAKLPNFGAGTHYCLSTALAKVAVEESLRALLAADPPLGLAEDPADIRGGRWWAAAPVGSWSLPTRPARRTAKRLPRRAVGSVCAGRTGVAVVAVGAISACRAAGAAFSARATQPAGATRATDATRPRGFTSGYMVAADSACAACPTVASVAACASVATLARRA
jgi:hypothetical protein